MNIRPFEIVLIGIFAVSALGGLFFFRMYKPDPSLTDVLFGDSVQIWGTLDARLMESYLAELTKDQKSLRVVTYRQLDKRSFQNELLNAIAEGKSPDLVILPSELLVTYRSKLQVIPFETMSERTFRDAYIDGADIFMRSDGIYGVPIAVDPLVMYWNRDIFSSSGVAVPPKTWETLVSQTTRTINRTDDWHNFTQSTVAFGEYANITHAKDVLSLLLLQAGSDIVMERDNARYEVVIDRNMSGQGLPPAQAVLSFYSQFAHPGKEAYSWNRSMDKDRNAFLSGTLALYFGFGSERGTLERDNANLNFDVAPVPQGSGVSTYRNYADFYAFSIPRASRNVGGAYAVANYLSDPARANRFFETFNFAPARRSFYTGADTDPFKTILYQSALISRAWLDPNPQESGEIFQAMVEGVLIDQNKMGKLITDARYSLESLFK